MSVTNTNLAIKDLELIKVLKDTISYQGKVLEKRKRLLHAIVHNVQHLASVNHTNAERLKTAEDRLEATEKYNSRLQDENHALTIERDSLRADQIELNRKRAEMAKMVIESQANAKEIE